jgi:arachidonate 15-lipoxygenase
LSLFTVPVLPQNDTPENRAARAAALQKEQGLYQYDYPSIVAGLPMAKAPFGVDLSVTWTIEAAEVALTLVENLVAVLVPNAFSFDIQVPITLGGSSFGLSKPTPPARKAPSLEELQVSEDVKRKVADLGKLLEDARRDLPKLMLGARKKAAPAAPPRSLGGGVAGFVSHLVSDAVHAVEDAVEKAVEGEVEAIDASKAGDWLADLIKNILDHYLSLVGLLGRPTDLAEYDAQFREVALPWPAGVFQTDEIFAEMRVAGPNPLVLRRATEADLKSFPVTDAGFQQVTGERDASLGAALAAGRLYLVDYEALTALVPGTDPYPKFVYAPKALFYVPLAGGDRAARRALRPFAIQAGQAADSPVYLADGSLAWSLAKLTVNIADGNYHELISHLGLTHLLTEPFVLATIRQLDVQHPLSLLLTPHFVGTLLINYAAQTTLITPGGPVDKLLSGTIESSDAVAATAVKAVRYNQTFLRRSLAARGVDKAEALPDYPYRDDALTVWDALHGWVSDYVSLYYTGSDDVTGDYELQAWVKELAVAGKIQDIGEGGAGADASIATVPYLVDLLTQVIFTASAQHAAVNFPQRTIMSYSPAIPLAGYAAFPAAPGAPATQALDLLPPLDQSVLQQALTVGLGGIYHTTLGGYGGQLGDPRALLALGAFQAKLRAVEAQINAANALGKRTAYTTLLPSAIPQSINI